MFGSSSPFGQSSSSPFGQSSSSPFGSQSLFGQASSATTNPFSPRPFGSPNPFGSPTGGSLFGSTSTGVFGQPSSPLGSNTPAFVASSAPAFGSSTPAFGAASTPAFGASSSSFGSSSIFGAKPTFGGFGSTQSQTSPFGSTFQQTQPAFGSNLFGSTSPFGAPSQPTFGATSTPSFGAASTPAFGATSTPAFGATNAPAFGASTPSFGATSTPAFGATTTPAFGATTTPAFGAASSPMFGSTGTSFGVPSTPAFGSTVTPAFGASTTSIFGSSSTPAFGVSSSPSFGFGSTPAFGQSTSAFGSSTFGTTSPFGAQSSPFGAQTTTSTFGTTGFGQPAFGGQQVGSRVTTYTPTTEADSGTAPAGKMESISAMPVYKDKSHEELRWEDYQKGDKGGPSLSGQPGGGFGFPTPTQTSPFGSTSTFGQTPTSSISTGATSLFGQKTPTFGSTGFGASSTPAFSSPFGMTSSSPFGSTTSSAAPSLFGSSTVPAFGASSGPSLFGGTSTSAFGGSLFGSSSTTGSTPAFGSSLTFGGTQSAGLFQSSPSMGQAPSLFGQPTSGFGQSAPAFGSSLFGAPSTGFGGSLFGSSTPSLVPTSSPGGFGQSAPSLSTPFQLAAPAQTPGAFSFGGFGQAQPAASSGFGGMPSVFGQGTFGQPVATQTSMVMQSAPMASPFGTLPAMPQMSIGHVGPAPSVQYGISSMPVAEKTILPRISSLLTPRHVSQRRIKIPARKYHPKTDGPMVPFFRDDEEASSTPKADALFIPRENPRALVIRPIEQWPSRPSTEKHFASKDMSALRENGKATGEASASARNGSVAQYHDETRVENGDIREDANAPSPSTSAYKSNGFHEDHPQKEIGSSYSTLSGRAGEAAMVYEHGADIEALMPKIRHPEYYTEPRIQELAAKERAQSGFCRHVRDFVVGRHGYGSIKFAGETDVRRLDLESLIQFNNREVIVYKDESKKPPVGQGLNKPAEVTLLNIKCINKKTGQQFTDGPRVERYQEMLVKKAEEQGAEFVSYDAVKGEWKFKVKHFSCYGEYSDDLLSL